MGADLYCQPLYSKNQEPLDSLFWAAVKKRNLLLAGTENSTSLRDLVMGTEEYKAAQEEVDRLDALIHSDELYFRDSYNGTSVLWRLGLSWWNDLPTNKEGQLRGANLKKFIKMVEQAPLKPVTKAELKKMHCVIDDGENSVEGWNEYYREKRERLLRFLKSADKPGVWIDCSC